MTENKILRFKKIPKARLADLVTSQLKESIFQGRFRPGEKLPSEHQLVESFGVSRVVIREALRNLERTGLVEIRQGATGGAFVLPMKHHAVAQVMKDVLRLGQAGVDHIMEARLHIEPIVAGLAAQRATQQDIRMLSRAVTGMPRVAGDEYVKWNVNFHRLLARCSHNPVYDVLVNILMDFTQELILRIKPAHRIIHDTVSHPAITEMVRRKDAQGARRIMRSHLQDIVPLLVQLESDSWKARSSASASQDK